MPAYLGEAHHASISFTVASYSLSSASPGFCDSGRSWKASAGCVAWVLREDILATDVEDMVRMARRGAQLLGLAAAEIKRWEALGDNLRSILRVVLVVEGRGKMRWL